MRKCKVKYQIVTKDSKVWDESDYKDVIDEKLQTLKKEYYGQGFKIKKCKY